MNRTSSDFYTSNDFKKNSTFSANKSGLKLYLFVTSPNPSGGQTRWVLQPYMAHNKTYSPNPKKLVANEITITQKHKAWKP